MISPLEALFILIVVLVLVIFFKPETVVRLAKSLGELRREMRKGERGSEE